MCRSRWVWSAITALVFSGPTHGSATRTVEVPVGKGGEVQIAEIIIRLARASGASLERPAAGPDLRQPWGLPAFC